MRPNMTRSPFSRPRQVIDGHKFYSVRGTWSETEHRAVIRSRLKALELNYAKGFSASSLDFLVSLPGLQRLILLDWRHTDLTAVASLVDLVSLHVSAAPSAQLDVVRMRSLKKLAVSALARIDGLPDCRLESLSISEWRGSSLAPLIETQEDLQHLQVKDARILNDVSAVGRLTNLVALELVGCRSLVAVPVLAFPELKSLSVAGSGGLVRLDFVAGLERLETLNFSDCGKIESLRALAGLPRLRHVFFYGNTSIVDGDLSVLNKLTELTKVTFQDRCHYNLRRKDIAAAARFL